MYICPFNTLPPPTSHTMFKILALLLLKMSLQGADTILKIAISRTAINHESVC